MSVYYDYSLDTGVHQPRNIFLAGHERCPLVAVACEGKTQTGATLGAVGIFTEEGILLPSARIQRSTPPVKLSWHPRHHLLAIGWKSGEIMVYNVDDGEVTETKWMHTSGRVLFLLWNSAGNMLVSGDDGGDVAVWQFERGRVGSTLVQSYLMEFDSLTCAVLHPIVESESPGAGVEISELARRAVEGDEAALDLFLTQQRMSTITSRRAGSPKPPLRKQSNIGNGRSQLAYFIGSRNGTVYHVNSKKDTLRVTELEGAIHSLHYFSQKSMLIAITDTQSLNKFVVQVDGAAESTSSFKLSFTIFPTDIFWTVPGVLAFSALEQNIRVWDFNDDEGCHVDSSELSGKVTSITYKCNRAGTQGTLVGGTDSGQIVQWWYAKPSRALQSTATSAGSDDTPPAWEMVDQAKVEYPIKQLVCMGGRNSFAYLHEEGVTLLQQGNMSACFNGQICAVQVSAGRVLVENVEKRAIRELRTDIHIKGLHATNENVLIWNKHHLAVYSITSDGSFRSAGSFDIHGSLLGLHKLNVLIAQGREVVIQTFSGTNKQSLLLLDHEGECDAMVICEPYVVIGSSEGFIRVFDLSRREPRTLRSCNVRENIDGAGAFYNIQCNSNGTCVSFQFKRQTLDVPDPRLFVWDFESDEIHVMNFELLVAGQIGSDDFGPPLSNASDDAKALALNRCPLSHFWDKKEPKLLICDCARVSGSAASNGKVSQQNSAPRSKVDLAAVVLFFSGEHGFLLQDCFSTEKTYTGLLGLCAPYIYFSKAPVTEDRSDDGHRRVQSLVAKELLRDFSDLDRQSRNNDDTRQALLDFSFHLALGNLDQAFAKVRKVKSKDIWTNLAKMCVKRQRLDVASVCLSMMGNCGALRALRQAKEKHPEPEVHLGVVALHLGMQSEAMELYRSCGRFDLVNKLQQACNEWEEAIQTAQRDDRIHLRNTYYEYAKHLEGEGNIPLAATYFEKADTHHHDVPRMLVGDLPHLEDYISKTRDPKLYSYWGAYLESMNVMETAYQFYIECGDYMGQVRVLCYQDRFAEAADTANGSCDKAACFHMARQYEGLGMPSQSVDFYTKALVFSSAITVAKDNQLDHELMGLALRSSKDDMVDVAEYFEENGIHDKAITLYQKGGAVAKALELAFLRKEFAALESMADDLDENTDPDILVRCAEFFLSHGQHERAVPILVSAKKYLEALDISLTHKVPITVEMAEKMTLPKSDDAAEMEHRNAILEKVAMCAEEHGLYQVACKKFTQGGMHVKAMKALIKSADVEKICFFANANRRKDLYVMAANWLHLQDWRNDPVIMKQIVAMYTKGKALDSLASFYESCAQLEVDDFRNYSKALTALEEAQKYINKARQKSTSVSLESQASFLETRIGLTQRFQTAKELFKTDAEQAVRQCRELLDETDIEVAVRIGDIYAVMVDYYAQQTDANQAYTLMQQLRQQAPDVNMAYFIPMSIIESVHRTLGIPLGRGLGAEETDGDVDEEQVVDDDEDEIANEF